MKSNFRSTISCTFLFSVSLFMTFCGTSDDEFEDMTLEEEEIIVEELSEENSILSFQIIDGNNTIEGSFGAPNNIYFEGYQNLDLTALKVKIEVSEGASVEPASGEIVSIEYIRSFIVTAENGDKRNYFATSFTSNLLKDPEGIMGDQYWTIPEYNGIQLASDSSMCFYTEYPHRTKCHIETQCAGIYQVVKFKKERGKNHVLFISEGWAEDTNENTIRGRPYMWGMRHGNYEHDFNDSKNVMQGQRMSTNEIPNDWQKMYGVFEIDQNLDSITFSMSQAHQVDDAPSGSLSKIRNVEIRFFNSYVHASHFIDSLYLNNN